MAHKEEIRAQKRVWEAAHRDERRASNRDHRRRSQAARRWVKAAWHATQKYGEAVAPDIWCAVWHGPCFTCGATPARGVDHIVPHSRGGRNIPENIQPACLPCNKRKAASLDATGTL